jgi:hypothetical protein
MEILLAAFFGALVTGLAMRANYRGHIQDLRGAVAYERKMRKYEEDRAETLSDALFGRTKTRQRNTEMPN